MNNEKNPTVLKPGTDVLSSEDNQPESLGHIDQKHQLELENIKQNIALKKKYANRIYLFSVFWCIGLFGLLFLQGFGYLNLHFSILVTLSGGTTASIIFTMHIILKGLFGENRDSYKHKIIQGQVGKQ